MPKSYFNNAIIGNSSMLGCLSNTGELIRFFWPNIDAAQLIDKFMVGVYCPEQRTSTLWLNEGQFVHRQKYIENTNVVETTMENYEKGLRVIQTDFCLYDSDVLVRNYDIENLSNNQVSYGLITASSFISANSSLSNILFDFASESLIHYRKDAYVSISASKKAYQFQLGNNAFESAWYGELKGYDEIGMMHDGALAYHLGEFMPGEKKTITIYFCVGKTLNETKLCTSSIKKKLYFSLLNQTKQAWQSYVDNAREITTDNEMVNSLYIRSLLVFRLMWDKSTGALMAAPEVDEEFTKCGRYAYCWGRDAAFITEALDCVGLKKEVDMFYSWIKRVQDTEGYWHQRYHMDGNIAPSWGLQIDETGTLLWGILSHYKHNLSIEFLKNMWESVERATVFLIRFIDKETGLPLPSFDLWEERMGEHTYSTAAVYAGIKAASEIGRILDKDIDILRKWEEAADSIKRSMEKVLWKEEQKSFLRSVRVKLNPWGAEPTSDIVNMAVNPMGYKREVSNVDSRTDISLLGVSIPFNVFEVNDYRVIETVKTIERKLTCINTGGIKRYEDDHYIGGNPWILTTLWVALYYIEKKDYSKARGYFEWAVKGRTELDLLPEQVSKEDGKPAWIFPLTWSHAMFVLVLVKLYEAGEI